ncbi:hypothetical protein AAG906_018063 [Vitis piasezkii]
MLCNTKKTPLPIPYLDWDDYESEPIVVDESYELTTIGSLIHLCYSIQSPFILSRDPDEMVAQDETDEYGTSVEIADTIDGAIPRDEYSDEMLMVDMSQITDDVQPTTTSPLDLFGVLAIEIVEDV